MSSPSVKLIFQLVLFHNLNLKAITQRQILVNLFGRSERPDAHYLCATDIALIEGIIIFFLGPF